MAVIKSGATSDQLTIDPISKAARVTLYDAADNPINYSETFKGVAATFRILGSAAVPQPLFTLANLVGSGKLVYLRGLYFACDVTAVLLTVACQIDALRTSAIPSGGTVLTKTAVDTALNSSANVILCGANASDGGAATAITAPVVGQGYIGRDFIPRQATAVGLVTQQYFTDLLPRYLLESDSLVIRAGQAIVVQITGTAASNAATNHYIVSCVWDEV